jgi:hypothetical protein
MASRSVLLMDFDNIFIGLWNLDRDLAIRFASEPGAWLQGLTERYLIDERRRWLVTRCYLNPAGYVYSDAAPNGRLYFSRFRPLWVSSGFEVIDTPNLAANKNAADIRMVIDALDLARHPAGYDEFVLASADSDFTPLLQRLRADDRLITIMSPGNASRAYTALADRIVDLAAIEALLDPNQPELPASGPPSGAVEATSGEVSLALIQAFRSFIEAQYAEAIGPLNIASLAQSAARSVPGARESNWLGAGSFTEALVRLALPNARMNTIHLWDEDRHQEPVPVEPFLASELPEVVELLSRTIDMPRLAAEAWPAVFMKLATYVSTHAFNLTESTKWTRDELARDDVPVGRAALNYVVRGAQMGGAPLSNDPPPSADDIANAFLRNLINQAYATGINIDNQDQQTIASWIGLSDPEEEDA